MNTQSVCLRNPVIAFFLTTESNKICVTLNRTDTAILVQLRPMTRLNDYVYRIKIESDHLCS